MLNTQPLPTVEPTCGNCKFFREPIVLRGKPVTPGRCCAHPQTLSKEADEWCGEHQPRTPAADSAPLTKRIAEDAKPCTRPPDLVD